MFADWGDTFETGATCSQIRAHARRFARNVRRFFADWVDTFADWDDVFAEAYISGSWWLGGKAFWIMKIQVLGMNFSIVESLSGPYCIF